MEQAVQVSAPKEKPTRQKRPHKKLSRKWIALILIVLVVAVVVAMCASARNNNAVASLALEDTTVLSPTELTYSIGATGTVASDNSQNVYSTQAYSIEKVFVEVGDAVNEGAVLCKLDSKTLIRQIEAKELTMTQSQKSAAQQVRTARDTYNAAKEAIDLGLNSGVLTAQTQVTTAYNAWQRAIKTYDDYLESLNLGQNSQLLQSKNTLQSAQQALDNAQASYSAAVQQQSAASSAYYAALEAAGNDLADPTVIEAYSLLQQATQAVSSANSAISTTTSSYTLARDTNKATERSTDIALEDYKIAADTAYQSYTAALDALAAAEQGASTQLQSSKNALSTAKISANSDMAAYELAKLYEDLDDTNITAPISGTVTAVYATEGASGTGLLFIIEDTNALKVETTVKEYDISTVQVGQNVNIRTDALENATIAGRITSIAPASQKPTVEGVDLSGDVLFDTEVTVLDRDTGLRIGMSVRLDYIIEQKSDILAVPYDAVYKNDAGQTCVLAITEADGGKYLVQEYEVTTGMETDLDIEISGAGLKNGMRIVNSPASLTQYIGQSIQVSERREANGDGFSLPFMNGQ